jgi:hypothetical protein
MPKTKKSNTVGASNVHLALDQMIAERRAKSSGATDGRIQVALSIAAVSSLVTVDATAHPFTTIPDDLFDRTFGDKEVGINDDQMSSFKAGLSVMLPQIKEDISQIPENSSLLIEKVAEFVRVSLLPAQPSE